MINEKSAREREAMLKRLRELKEEMAQLQCEAKEAEARLPTEEQFRRNLERLIEMKMPHAAGKVHVEIMRLLANTAAVSPVQPQKTAAGTKIKKFHIRFGR